MKSLVQWFRIGSGSRLHSISLGRTWTACGINGPKTGPYENENTESKCKKCMKCIANAPANVAES